MPVPLLGSNFLAGATNPALTGGTATSGPAVSGIGGPVNIGGLFGSPASSSGSWQTIALVAAVAVLGVVLLKRK